MSYLADNIVFQGTAPATPASGVSVATDDVGGVQFQRVKLDKGTNGVSDPVTDLATDTAVLAGNVMLDDIRTATESIAAGTPAVQGQQLMAASQPVVVASNQTAIPITVATIPSHAVTNAGTFVAQLDGAALTALQLIDDTVLVDDAAFTPASSKLTVSGLFADETGTDSVDEGDVGSARMTLDRKAIVTPQPHSAGGLSIYRSIDLDEGALEVVKASPGCVYGMWVTNTATTTRWIKFYDATSGTAGTGTPVITIGIPGNASDDVSGNFGPGGMGIQFSTGICFGAVTGVADADVGAPGANDVIANVYFK